MRSFFPNLLLTLLLAIPVSGFALDRTWMGTSSDFHTASNWMPSGVPGSGERAIISGDIGNQPTITADCTVGEIVLDAGSASPAVLTVDGADVTVEQAVIVNCGVTQVSQVNLINSGTITTDTLNINPSTGGNADVNIGTGCSMTVTASCTVSGAVAHSGRIRGAGSFLIGPSATMTCGSTAGQPVEFTVALTQIQGDLVAAQSEIQIGDDLTTVTLIATGAGSSVTTSGSGVKVKNSSTLRTLAGGQLATTGSFFFEFDSSCVLDIDSTQTGMLGISVFAPSGTPALLRGSANPIFGAAANVTIESSNGTGGFMRVDESGMINAGNVLLDSSNNNSITLVIPGSTNFTTEGVLELNGDTSDQAIINGAGVLIVSITGTLRFSGNGAVNTILNNTGTVEAISGQSSLGQPYTQTDSNSVFDVQGSAQITVSGTMSLGDGGLIVNGTLDASSLELNGSSVLEGSGTVNAPVTNDATIRPGGAAQLGLLTLNGAYSQTSMGRLEIDISSASEFDQLFVMGNTTLAHEIEFDLINGYVPANNQLLTNVVQALSGTISGTFSLLSQDSGTPNVTLSAEYSAMSVNLRAANGALPPAPTVSSVTASRTIAPLGAQIVFTATATDPSSLPLTFSWDFKDGSTGSGNPVTHTFNQAGTFVVQVTASNGSTSGTGTVSVDILGPNSGGSGETNVGQGKPAVTNPLNGIALSVQSSNGGVVELAIDVDALNRDDFDLLTAFDLIQGRKSARPGPKPTEKFTEPAIAVATTTATDAGSTNERGKARRQIAVSSREVGQPVPFTNPPVDRSVKLDSIKGKFLFSDTKPDQFTFTGRIELPEGLDLSQPRKLELGIGNILDSVEFDVKGKTKQLGALNRIVKAQVKYPKVPKDNPLTKAGQEARLTITMKGVNFSDQGFDTEGIAATLRSDEEGQKSVQRSIQASILFAGATFEGAIPVQFKLTKDADSGMITGRSSAK